MNTKTLQEMIAFNAAELEVFVIKVDETENDGDDSQVFWNRDSAEVELARRRWIDLEQEADINDYPDIVEALDSGVRKGFGEASSAGFSPELARLFNEAWDQTSANEDVGNFSRIDVTTIQP